MTCSQERAQEKWPPSEAQVDYFLAEFLTVKGEDEAPHVEELKLWYTDDHGKDWNSLLRKQSHKLSLKLPFKDQSASTDSVRCVIMKDSKAQPFDDKDVYNCNLLRYFIEKEWELERPDVIISVTGGATAFDLPANHKDMIMKGAHATVRPRTPRCGLELGRHPRETRWQQGFGIWPWSEALLQGLRLLAKLACVHLDLSHLPASCAGMMENTREMNATFITGGTNAGIMK